MFEAGEELFRKRVKRVAGRSLYALPLIRGRMKPEEVFQNSEIGGLQVLSKNPFPDDSFVRKLEAPSRGRPPSFPRGAN
jgi:hypothetical protein